MATPPTFLYASGSHDSLTALIDTFSWTIPATAQAGDVAVIMVGLNAAPTNTFPTPTGWTAIGATVSTGNNHNSQAFGRVLTASDPSTVVTTTLATGAGKIHGGGFVIRGAKGIPSAGHFTSVTDTTTGATVAGPSITTDSSDNFIVNAALIRNTTAAGTKTTTGVGTGWTKRADTGTAHATAPNFNSTFATRDAAATSTGAVTGVTFTSTDTASTGHVWAFAFEPAVSTNTVPPTVNAGPDQTVEPYSLVTLPFTATDPDGSIAAYTVNQTAGATVTLSQPSLGVRTFPAPGTIDGDVLTFSVTATDSGGNVSTPDTVSVTVLPVTERAAVGGVWVPLELRAL